MKLKNKGEREEIYTVLKGTVLEFCFQRFNTLQNFSGFHKSPSSLYSKIWCHGIVGGLMFISGNAVLKRNVHEIGGIAHGIASIQSLATSELSAV